MSRARIHLRPWSIHDLEQLGNPPGRNLPWALALVLWLSIPLFPARADPQDAIRFWLDAPTDAAALPRSTLAALAAQLRPSVVAIDAESAARAGETAHATGCVISERGYIVTTNGAVENRKNFRVRLADGHEFHARLAGRDPSRNVALLEVEPTPALRAATLGTAEWLRVGDSVLTLGFADPASASLAKGIVAGKARKLDPAASAAVPHLQLDMKLVAGFSGAPLVDLHGHVVGIVSSARNETGTVAGVSFAIPIEAAKRVLPRLRERRRRGWLGVAIGPIPPELASSLGLPDRRGAAVTSVIEDSPAARAHLVRGDIIVGFDGHQINARRDLVGQVAATRPGSIVELVILRGGEERRLRATIEERTGAARREAAPPASVQDHWGLWFEELSIAQAEALSLPQQKQGIVVSRIEPGGPAERAGLQIGDLLVELGGRRIRTVGALAEGLREEVPLLLVERHQHTFFVGLSE